MLETSNSGSGRILDLKLHALRSLLLLHLGGSFAPHVLAHLRSLLHLDLFKLELLSLVPILAFSLLCPTC